ESVASESIPFIGIGAGVTAMRPVSRSDGPSISRIGDIASPDDAAAPCAGADPVAPALVSAAAPRPPGPRPPAEPAADIIIAIGNTTFHHRALPPPNLIAALRPNPYPEFVHLLLSHKSGTHPYNRQLTGSGSHGRRDQEQHDNQQPCFEVFPGEYGTL